MRKCWQTGMLPDDVFLEELSDIIFMHAGAHGEVITNDTFTQMTNYCATLHAMYITREPMANNMNPACVDRVLLSTIDPGFTTIIREVQRMR